MERSGFGVFALSAHRDDPSIHLGGGAAGQVEVWVEPKVAPWDLAGPSIILEEAGACFFDLQGRNSIYGGSAAACVPALEAEVKRFLQLA